MLQSQHLWLGATRGLVARFAHDLKLAMTSLAKGESHVNTRLVVARTPEQDRYAIGKSHQPLAGEQYGSVLCKRSLWYELGYKYGYLEQHCIPAKTLLEG